MSGTQMQHAKESNADIMRQKQAAGMSQPTAPNSVFNHDPKTQSLTQSLTAEARKAAEGKK